MRTTEKYADHAALVPNAFQLHGADADRAALVPKAFVYVELEDAVEEDTVNPTAEATTASRPTTSTTTVPTTILYLSLLLITATPAATTTVPADTPLTTTMTDVTLSEGATSVSEVCSLQRVLRLRLRLHYRSANVATGSNMTHFSQPERAVYSVNLYVRFKVWPMWKAAIDDGSCMNVT